jgi:hypothetical protein
MKKPRVVKVTLHYDQKTVAQKFQFARAIVTAMTGNPKFPNPSIALSDITTDANNLEAAYLASLTRTKGTASHVKDATITLRIALTKLAGYVEGVANADAATAETTISFAGMQPRKAGTHKGHVLAVVSKVKGQVLLTCLSAKGVSYKWEVAIGDPTVEANWKVLAEVKQSKTIQRGLNSGTLYHFRVWTIGKTGISPAPSQVLSTIVL